MALASEADQVRDILESVRAALPAIPGVRVVGAEFELGTDQVDDPAVFVVVLLDEKTSDADWTSQKLEPIADRFRKALFDAGVSRWPYVRFSRPSELKAAD